MKLHFELDDDSGRITGLTGTNPDYFLFANINSQ